MLKEGQAKGTAGWKEAKAVAVIKSAKTAPSKITLKVRERHVNRPHAQEEAAGRMTADS